MWYYYWCHNHFILSNSFFRLLVFDMYVSHFFRAIQTLLSLCLLMLMGLTMLRNGWLGFSYLYQLWQFCKASFASMHSYTTNLNIFTLCRNNNNHTKRCLAKQIHLRTTEEKKTVKYYYTFWRTDFEFISGKQSICSQHMRNRQYNLIMSSKDILSPVQIQTNWCNYGRNYRTEIEMMRTRKKKSVSKREKNRTHIYKHTKTKWNR